ncbi:MAG: Acyl-CoA hydrolase [Parachlamydiales bacterium]|nr:Acyl-CoA hydrolase [Parachlamydiales bacterium]
MDAKTVSASAISDQVIEIYPDDLNQEGTLFEGRVMQMVNSLALTVARRHTGCSCVARGIHSLRFMKKASHGDILVCKASVNRSWPLSMEVGVKVVAEDFRTLEQKEILSAYFTFIAIDDDHQPIEIAPVIPETPEEERRFQEAELRRRYHENQLSSDGLISPNYSSVS